MGTGIIIALAHGVGLLALVLLAYRHVLRRFGTRRGAFAAYSGLLFGVAAVLSMLDAYPVADGVLVDLRNAMIGLAGLFGGWPAALLSAAIAAAVRLWLGGVGAATGLAGLALTALAAPLLARPMERRAAGPGSGPRSGKGAFGFGLLALFGLALAPLSLPAVLLLPDFDLAMRVMEEAALPLIAFTALGIGLLGTMLAREHRRVADEAMLAESAALFRAVFDSSADIHVVLRVNPGGSFTLHCANEAAARAMGERLATARGKPLDALLPPDLAAKAMADLQSCIDADAPTRFEEQHTHNGVTRWWEVSQVPIRDESGAIALLSVGARDITRRHEAERAIRASEARYRLLARGVTDIIGRIGLDGVRRFCSEATRDSLGCPPAELVGRPLVERVHPDDRDALSAGLSRLTPDRPTLKTTYRLRHADGRWVWMEAAVRLVTDDWGAPQEYVSVERDVTARKFMEAELQDARHAAEAASRSKSEFLASLSHELRTPMNAVIGFADLIARESEGPVGTAHYRDFAVNIRDSGQHLLELINEILDHVRAESGQLVLDDEPVDLDAAATFAVRLLTPRAARAGIALSAQVAPAARHLRGDERRIRQILLNLLSNAVKYTPSGGSVSLTADPAPDGGLLLEVRDNGVGIPEQDLDRVLLAYARVATPENRQTEGAGLGLPLTRRLVELHGGVLTLASRVGQGTTVTIHFPPERVAGETGGEPAAAPAAHPSAQPAGGRPGLSILMVDDDHNIRETGSALLRSWGHRVIAASGAGEALVVLRGPEPLDLLFSDIVMPPGMNGAELAREARRLRPDLPVLLASGFAAHAVVADDVAMGGYDLIAKPYDAAELRGHLDRLRPPASPRGPGQTPVPAPSPARSPTATPSPQPQSESQPEPQPDPAAEPSPPPLPPPPPAAAEPPAPRPAAAPPAGGALRILVVEDVEMNRLLAVTLLKQAGHRVAAVEDGAQAVEAVARAAMGEDGGEPFDAILMDINMPVMDGLEATRLIRAMPGPESRVAIVALTANTFPDDIARCYEAGMDCHVPKPIDRAQLLSEVARCVASRRAVETMG
ncbi:response regulator [Azospirillum sp. TSH64]|uniref:response regulator n=1 Tax=Azospirillum sp. TSH64 TaxID=652740 RepID=UPI000D6120A5|nr:response regulator [Azospirillum sp. TSH64]PWC78963.1 histidine kinase [Azospirillum sp. TSH64]